MLLNQKKMNKKTIETKKRPKTLNWVILERFVTIIIVTNLVTSEQVYSPIEGIVSQSLDLNSSSFIVNTNKQTSPFFPMSKKALNKFKRTTKSSNHSRQTMNTVKMR